MRWFLVLPFFLFLPNAFGADARELSFRKCPRFYAGIRFSEDTVSAKLRDVPGLKSAILRFLEDPLLPPSLKRNINVALERSDLTIVQLSEEFRRIYLFPADFNAAKVRFLPTGTKSKVAQVNRPTALSANARGTKEVIAPAAGNVTDTRRPYPFRPGLTVLVQDRRLSRTENDLVTLAHELSHVRFDAFMERHFEKLYRKFPPDLVKRLDDGTFEIDEQLWSYLDERFAHETEYRVLEATHGRYFSDWFDKYGDESFADLPEASRQRMIASYIGRVYEITDPRLRALDSRKLSDILLHGFR